MSYLIQRLKNFPVVLGNLTIYLSGFQLSASSTLKESGTADGAFVLAGCWKQGIRIKLKGKLSPDYTPEDVLLSLTQSMLTKQTFTLGTLSFQNAMLCGYTLADQQDTPELSLVFYCPQSPVVIGEEISS